MQFSYSTLTYSIDAFLLFTFWGKTVNGIWWNHNQKYSIHDPQYDFQLKSEMKLKGFFCRLLQLLFFQHRCISGTHTPKTKNIYLFFKFVHEMITTAITDTECWNEWKINKIFASFPFVIFKWNWISFVLFYLSKKIRWLFRWISQLIQWQTSFFSPIFPFMNANALQSHFQFSSSMQRRLIY